MRLVDERVVGVKRDEASSPGSKSSAAQLAGGSWRGSEDRSGGRGLREGRLTVGCREED